MLEAKAQRFAVLSRLHREVRNSLKGNIGEWFPCSSPEYEDPRDGKAFDPDEGTWCYRQTKWSYYGEPDPKPSSEWCDNCVKRYVLFGVVRWLRRRAQGAKTALENEVWKTRNGGKP